MRKYILTTGPALANEVPLKDIHSDKHIYRINGAHGSVEDIFVIFVIKFQMQLF